MSLRGAFVATKQSPSKQIELDNANSICNRRLLRKNARNDISFKSGIAFDRQPQPIIQFDGWTVAQFLLCKSQVGAHAGDASGCLGIVDDFGFPACDIENMLN